MFDIVGSPSSKKGQKDRRRGSVEQLEREWLAAASLKTLFYFNELRPDVNGKIVRSTPRGGNKLALRGPNAARTGYDPRMMSDSIGAVRYPVRSWTVL
jgi:hypothetical protein